MNNGTTHLYNTPDLNGDPTVYELLGAGGQGEVYRAVDRAGRVHALKWFRDNAVTDSEGLRGRLGRLISHGAPSRVFLWPERIVEGADGAFGYLMPLRPEGYFELGDFFCIDLCPEAWFRSNSAKVGAATAIAKAIATLHKEGLCYGDINEGSFFINPIDGDVLVADNDNISAEGTDAGIRGKVRYMAPEVAEGTVPDRRSDALSLAIILYRIFCVDHPFEGKATPDSGVLTPAGELARYGAEAVFCHDADDRSNAASADSQPNSLHFWPLLPDILREAFRKALSREAILNPEKRTGAAEWVEVLYKVRDSIYTCREGGVEHDFFTGGCVPEHCPLCGTVLKTYPAITFGDGTKIALYPGRRIYAPGSDEPEGICTTSNVAGKGVTLVIAPVDPDDPDSFFRIPVPGKKIRLGAHTVTVSEK